MCPIVFSIVLSIMLLVFPMFPIVFNNLTLVCFGFETNFEVQDQHRAGSFMSIQ